MNRRSIFKLLAGVLPASVMSKLAAASILDYDAEGCACVSDFTQKLAKYPKAIAVRSDARDYVAKAHKIWEDCEAAGVPLEKRPMALQVEPTEANWRVLGERIMADLDL